jgi:hypothetical protein
VSETLLRTVALASVRGAAARIPPPSWIESPFWTVTPVRVVSAVALTTSTTRCITTDPFPSIIVVAAPAPETVSGWDTSRSPLAFRSSATPVSESV